MYNIRGKIDIRSLCQQAFKIKSRQAKGGAMSVYASKFLFLRLSRIIEANKLNGIDTCGSFIISGRVLINFKLGKKTEKEAGNDKTCNANIKGGVNES